MGSAALSASASNYGKFKLEFSDYLGVDYSTEFLLNSQSITLYRWSKDKGEYLVLEPNNSTKDSAVCMSDIIQGYEKLEN